MIVSTLKEIIKGRKQRFGSVHGELFTEKAEEQWWIGLFFSICKEQKAPGQKVSLGFFCGSTFAALFRISFALKGRE